jgi:hypothetical protein
VNLVTKEHPTPKLRFVQREVVVPISGRGNVGLARELRILQQEWEIVELENGMPMAFRFEWRDVPLEVDA